MGIKEKSKKTIPVVLPVEIIIEILLKLPVISLLRCKSVCESWYSLLSDQYFIKAHYTLSRTNNHYEQHRLIYNTVAQRNNLYRCPLSDLLFYKSVNNVLELEKTLQRTQPQALSIVGSCNGLICLFLENDDDYNLFIYNPSTRICNGLPFRRKKGRRKWRARYSFGYDESSDDYKVVKMSRRVDDDSDTEDETDIRVHIYSVKTGNWKRLGDCSQDIQYATTGVYLNGALHWLAYESRSSLTQRIVSLDLEKETYGEVLQAEYDEGGKGGLTLGVLGEWLCVLCTYHGSREDVWAMKVYGVKHSWTKLLSIPYQTHLGTHYVSRPLCISNDGKVLLENRSKWVIYDCINSSCSEIQNFDGFRKACIVVESLVSPFPDLDY